MAAGGGHHKRNVLLAALAVAAVAAVYATGLTFHFSAQHRASAVIIPPS
jgi:hypothetical protein